MNLEQRLREIEQALRWSDTVPLATIRDIRYLLSVVRTLAAAVEALCGLIHASETELTLRSFPLDELKRVRMAVDRATVLLRTGEVPQDGPATPTATPPG